MPAERMQVRVSALRSVAKAPRISAAAAVTGRPRGSPSDVSRAPSAAMGDEMMDQELEEM